MNRDTLTDRRTFVAAVGAGLVGLAGCMDAADGPHGTPEEPDDTLYEYDREYFKIQSAFISRNAPTDVGVTVRLVSEQFAGESVPVEFQAVDGDGNIVFHEPVLEVGMTGGTASVATAWFEATEEQFEMDLYPKVRLRSEPPTDS